MGPNKSTEQPTFYAVFEDGRVVQVSRIADVSCAVRSSETKIKKVIFHKPATIVYWEDGTKTVVKCTKGDVYNYEMGIAMCMLKKIFGDSYRYFKKDVKKWIPEPRKDGWSMNVQVAPDYSQKVKEHMPDFAEAFADFLRKWGDEYDRDRAAKTAD